jgi:hypothetical protein
MGEGLTTEGNSQGGEPEAPEFCRVDRLRQLEDGDEATKAQVLARGAEIVRAAPRHPARLARAAV